LLVEFETGVICPHIGLVCYNSSMSQLAHRVTPSLPKAPAVPPLQNGDRLTRAEFERRYDATPGLKKAELIDGRVYIAADLRGTHSSSSSLPPLENGDRLTGEEFVRRYDAMAGLKKAELMDGRVYVSPPVAFDRHGYPHLKLVTLFGTYMVATPGVQGGDDATLRVDSDNWPQPDVVLMVAPSRGGQSKIDSDDILAGAPELVAEIAASSASYDLHDKLQLYRRAGVREYIVWRTLDGEFDYFVLRQGDYARFAPAADGLFHSEVFPGLWLDTSSLLKGDLAVALARLQEGIASTEHTLFITELQRRAASGASKPT
jgi:Uma2 family endonuclease